ncbi:MAG: hypothetical protein MUF30_00825 [Burkholderiales bacterium]|jgi:hypothetical protein|nr:hypothetical protein [Burkholderiales bacterium]
MNMIKTLSFVTAAASFAIASSAFAAGVGQADAPVWAKPSGMPAQPVGKIVLLGQADAGNATLAAADLDTKALTVLRGQRITPKVGAGQADAGNAAVRYVRDASNG